MMKRPFDNLETVTQFAKFCLVGVLNTAIHYAIFLTTFRILRINYLVATTVGYGVAVLNSFVLNKKWTFKTIHTHTEAVFIKFVVVNVLSWLTNLLALKLIVQYTGLRPELAQIFAIVFSTTTNFLGNKLWTFHQAEHVVSYPISNLQQPTRERDL